MEVRGAWYSWQLIINAIHDEEGDDGWSDTFVSGKSLSLS